MPESQGTGPSAPEKTREGFALITGASSGIGACFVRALAARGTPLVLVARSQDKLEALAREIRVKHSRRVEVLPRDLSLDGAANSLCAELHRRGIAVHLLINNAGFGAHGRFWQLPLDRQTEMLHLNIVALTELTRLLLPSMVARRGGGIINISSTASFQPVPFTSVYAATKAFVTSFSMGLAEELRGSGVRVVALCPGGTATNFFDAGAYSTREMPGGLQTPEEVVEVGLRALEKGRTLAIPRFLNRLMVASLRLAPRGLVVREAGNIFRPKGPEAGK